MQLLPVSQEYLCSPAEAQRRAATLAVRGELHDEVPSSSSMSHVGSSAATWGSTQDTQFGTAGQQASAAAAIMLSQMLDEDQAAPQQPADIAATNLLPLPEKAAAAKETKHDGEQNVEAQVEQHAVGGQLSNGAYHGIAAGAQQMNALMDFPATEVQHPEPTELQDSDVLHQESARHPANHQAAKALHSAQRCKQRRLLGRENGATEGSFRTRRTIRHSLDNP